MSWAHLAKHSCAVQTACHTLNRVQNTCADSVWAVELAIDEPGTTATCATELTTSTSNTGLADKPSLIRRQRCDSRQGRIAQATRGHHPVITIAWH